jgi:hypothetical protein
LNGDRNFAGFGSAPDSYADCFIDAANLPMEKIEVRAAITQLNWWHRSNDS